MTAEDLGVLSCPDCRIAIHLIWAGVVLSIAALVAVCVVAAARPVAELLEVVVGLSMLLGPATGSIGVGLHLLGGSPRTKAGEVRQ